MDEPARKTRGEELDFGLVAAMRRLTPEQRLDAFLEHCQLMMELYNAGEEVRRRRRSSNKDASLG